MKFVFAVVICMSIGSNVMANTFDAPQSAWKIQSKLVASEDVVIEAGKAYTVIIDLEFMGKDSDDQFMRGAGTCDIAHGLSDATRMIRKGSEFLVVSGLRKIEFSNETPRKTVVDRIEYSYLNFYGVSSEQTDQIIQGLPPFKSLGEFKKLELVDEYFMAHFFPDDLFEFDIVSKRTDTKYKISCNINVPDVISLDYVLEELSKYGLLKAVAADL